VRLLRKGWPRWLGLPLLLALQALLSACSALPFAYGQAPTLAYWWADRYADFTPEQSNRAKAAFEAWMDWHRRGPLSEDIALLERWADEMPRELSAARACELMDTLQQRRGRYLEPLLPALFELAATLEPRQLERIAARQASRNEDWRDEHLQSRPLDRAEADAKRIRDYAELLYGKFDAAQRRFLVERFSQPTPWDAQRWYTAMLAQQAATRRGLEGLATSKGKGPAGAAAREQLAATLNDPTAAEDAATRAWRADLRKFQCELTAEMHQRMSASQRERAARTLRDWAQGLRAYVIAPPQ
jgi:hypothetical protein